MKEIVLKISHINWGLIGPGTWNNTEWKIYNDLTVDIEKAYNIIKNESDKNNSKYSYNLSKESYDDLIEKIELVKNDNIKVDACDGSAWKIIQYHSGKEVWKREADYIYGIKPLEEISVILENLIKN